MKNQMIAGISLLAMVAGAPALADDHDPASTAELEARIEQLEATNAQLIEILRAQGLLPGSEGAAQAPAPAAPAAPVHTAPHQGVHTTDGHHAMHDDEWHNNLVGVSPNYGYRILDHAEGVNRRELTILQAMQNVSWIVA